MEKWYNHWKIRFYIQESCADRWQKSSSLVKGFRTDDCWWVNGPCSCVACHAM